MLTWRGIADELKEHRTRLLQANLVALLAVAAAVPVPLLLPLMVDEVLLHHPGRMVAAIGAWFPPAWHGPVLFIGVALLLTVGLRLMAILLNVWQGRAFSLLAKEVVYRIRVRMLNRLSKIALSQFETVGAGRVTSHFVTDLNAIDSFLGASISGLVVSVLTLVGVAAVLFWMHWQLALFILLLNPIVILFSTRRVDGAQRDPRRGAARHAARRGGARLDDPGRSPGGRLGGAGGPEAVRPDAAREVNRGRQTHPSA